MSANILAHISARPLADTLLQEVHFNQGVKKKRHFESHVDSIFNTAVLRLCYLSRYAIWWLHIHNIYFVGHSPIIPIII